MLSSFLSPMLRLYPDKRARASELVHHAWLDGIIVQGEIELIRQAEEEELLRRESERKMSLAGIGAVEMSSTVSVGSEGRARLARAEERHQLEEQRDADALKPVDDLDDTTMPDEADEQTPAVTTSSNAYKENQIGNLAQPVLQQPLTPHQGHKHQGSKGSSVRIDTAPALPSPVKTANKRRD
ncbi:hypothetical protein EW145_g8035 [Phellinidium pouzarii]|uniref:Uncharacterized protein n=1 Tax=Phellinidium pouzarii TaxID=167371 RepID=A0A4S4KAP2_9AGAM|nr:hypothetical protein EW145_g8035 [Phellinidium pouzarii]